MSITEPKKQGGNYPLLLKSRGDFQKEGGISRKGSLIKKYNKIHEDRCSMLYHIPNVLPLHIKGQFLEDFSLFLNFLSRGTVGFDSGELSDVVSLF